MITKKWNKMHAVRERKSNKNKRNSHATDFLFSVGIVIYVKLIQVQVNDQLISRN